MYKSSKHLVRQEKEKEKMSELNLMKKEERS